MPADPDLGLIFQALEFAARKHRDQRRKDAEATPYINHPIDVARVLVETGEIRDPAVICAALLHDTIEDTNTTPEELEALFGGSIAAIVREVTDDKSLAKAERKRQQVLNASAVSSPAQLVKLADKICNLRDISNSPPAEWELERKQAYFDWARDVVNRLRGVHKELERLFDEEYSKRP